MIRSLLAALALGSLSACASFFVPDKPAYVLTPQQITALTERRTVLATLPGWDLAGRIAVRKGDEIWTGQLIWQEQAGRYLVQFNAPTGQGALRLSGGPEGVELRLADGGRVQADDADSLIREQTGWQLPLNGMRQWILGLPTQAPIDGLDLDEQGRPLFLEQSGWTVQYKRYTQDVLNLPTKIDLQNQEISIRLVIHRWTPQT